MNASYGIAPRLYRAGAAIGNRPRPAPQFSLLGRGRGLTSTPMRAISIFLLWLIASAMNAPAQPNPLRRARQCIVVRSPTWDSPTGELRQFERSGSRAEWKPRGGVVPVVLGKKGLAWGKGAVEMNAR